MIFFLASFQSKMRGGHKNPSRRDLKYFGRRRLACSFWLQYQRERQKAAVRAGYIHYLVGQVETMKMSQARVVLEGLCPVWVEDRAIEKCFMVHTIRRQLLRGILRSQRVRAPPMSGSRLVQSNLQEFLKSPRTHQ